MVNKNRLLILAIGIIALVALAGVASACTVTVDKVQRNGHYLGTPVLLSGDTKKVGYSYDFYPDGTYTIFGTVTNYDNRSDLQLYLEYWSSTGLDDIDPFVVPAATDMFYAVGPNAQGREYGWTKPSTASFTMTISGNEKGDDLLFQYICYGIEQRGFWDEFDIVNAGDNTQHTVDEGPMSNAVAIYANGKFNFGNSTLYSFAQ